MTWSKVSSLGPECHLVHFETTPGGYTLYLTDLICIYAEELSEDEVICRAQKCDSPIDPKIQLVLLLEYVEVSLKGKHKKTLQKTKAGLEFKCWIEVPELISFVWLFQLRLASPNVLPLLHSLFTLVMKQSMESDQMLSIIKDKDFHIRAMQEKLLDVSSGYKAKSRRKNLNSFSIEDLKAEVDSGDPLETTIECLRASWGIVGRLPSSESQKNRVSSTIGEPAPFQEPIAGDDMERTNTLDITTAVDLTADNCQSVKRERSIGSNQKVPKIGTKIGGSAKRQKASSQAPDKGQGIGVKQDTDEKPRRIGTRIGNKATRPEV